MASVSPGLIGLITLACVLGGVVLGTILRRVVPAHHLSGDSKDAVRVGMGVVATMTALLLGLLIAFAKQSYDDDRKVVVEMAAKVALLDRVLAVYGPEAAAARESLRGVMTAVADRMWPPSSAERAQLDPAASDAAPLFHMIDELKPADAEQQAIKEHAIGVTAELAELRWKLFGQSGGAGSVGSVGGVLLAMVILWLTLIFISFGLYAPRNATVLTMLGACALAVSCAVFLILELDQPFEGMIRVSGEPMRATIAHLGK